MKFIGTQHTRELSSAEITESTKIECIDNGLLPKYRIDGPEGPIVFETCCVPEAGDRIVRKEDGTYSFVPEYHYRKVFQDLPDDLDIQVRKQVDSDVRVANDGARVTGYYRRKNDDVKIIEINKAEGSWIMGYCTDVSGYDMVSALTILATFDAVVRKVKEIDPDGWDKL
jgi:hypothetical protein